MTDTTPNPVKQNTQIGATAAILGVIAFGVMLRVVVVLLLADYPLMSDAFYYYEMALQLMSGEVFGPFWPPGVPYYLTVFYSLFGQSEVVARVAMILFYVVSSAGLYLFISEVISRRAALVAVLIFTIYPNYLFHSVAPLTQLPVATYLIWVAYLTHLLVRRWVWWQAVLLGVIFGVMILTRAGSISVLPVVLLYIGWRNRRIWPLAVPIVVVGLVITPYLVRVYRIDNHFIFVNYANSLNLFYGNNPDTPLYRTWLFGSDVDARPESLNFRNWQIVNQNPPYRQDTLYRQDAITHIMDRPDLFAVRTLSRLRAFWGFDMYTGARLIEEGITGTVLGLMVLAVDAAFYVSLMAAAVVFLMLRRWQGVPVLLILAMTFAYAAPYFVAFSHATYHFPVVPLLAVFSVGLLEKADLRLVVRQQRRAIGLALAVFAVIQLEWGLVMMGEFLA